MGGERAAEERRQHMEHSGEPTVGADITLIEHELEKIARRLGQLRGRS